MAGIVRSLNAGAWLSTGRVASLLIVASVVLAAASPYLVRHSVLALLRADAERSAHEWAHLFADLPDLDATADGGALAPAASHLVARASHFGSVFMFKLFDRHGNLRLVSDRRGTSGEANAGLAVHNGDAARVALSGRAFAVFRTGAGKPDRPEYYSEAYVPLVREGTVMAVVEVYLDQTERFADYRSKATSLAAAFLLLTILSFGTPSLLLYARSRQVDRAKADLRRQYLLFEGAIDNMAHGLSMFDGDNRIVVTNRNYAELYSLPPHIVTPGTHLLDLVAYALQSGILADPRVLPATEATLEEIARGQPLERTWRLADGRTIAFTISPLATGGWVAIHRDVTAERKAEAQLAASEERFRNFTATACDWCWETDKDHRFSFFSEAFQNFTGIDPAAIIGKTRSECDVHPDDRPVVEELVRNVAEHKPFRDFLSRIRRPNGGFAWVRSNGSPRFDAKGRFLGYRGTARDVTEEERRQEMLMRTERLLKRRSKELYESQRLGRLGDWSYQLGDTQVWWPQETFELLRYDPTSFHPTRDAVMATVEGDGARRVLEAQALLLETGAVQTVDVKIRRGDGSLGDFALTSTAMRGAEGRIVGFVGTIQDISERKQAEEKLEKLAYYDPLTGLANRALFCRELDEVFARCQAGAPPAALFLLDLDRFKEINDTLGHTSGDELLARIGGLIGSALGNRHFVARLGGDEFGIIASSCADEAAGLKLAGELIAAISGTVRLERGEVSIGTSVGLVLIPRDGTDGSDLLRNADLALYRAKENGRGCFAVFRPEMSSSIQDRLALAWDLRRAIADNQGLSVHYQPQVQLSTGRVSGYEALIRWSHPTRGNVPPSQFIPIAESSRLICDLGAWILRQACTQAKAWLDAGEPPRSIAVNISAAQIWHSNLASQVREVLEQTGLPPHLLNLELTESLLADHAEGRVSTALAALNKLGVRLALDDFGTDYSSLGYLNQLPFDELKIDRVFVSGITESQRSREVLKGIIGLGIGLGMTVLAEGAEKDEEVAILRALGCDLVQGFAFARPAPAAAALAFAQECDRARATFDAEAA